MSERTGPCPKGGEHMLDSEEGSSGWPYYYCMKCGEIWDFGEFGEDE